MKKQVLLTAIPVGESSELDHREYNLTITLQVNEALTPTRETHTFGCWGTPTRNEDMSPFVVYRSGEVDFGNFDSDRDRFGGTTILDLVTIEEGARFEFTSDDAEYEYAIKTVAVIGGQ